MAESKVEITVGEIHFSGEGQSKWVAEQLDKILDKAEALVSLAPAQNSEQPPPPPPQDDAIAGKTLPVFLDEKNAKNPQVRRLLATAVWLHAQGSKSLKTGDVTAALRASHQQRLSNASHCLAQNIKKGYCEKHGREFFVTDEGKGSL